MVACRQTLWSAELVWWGQEAEAGVELGEEGQAGRMVGEECSGLKSLSLPLFPQ